MELKSLNSVAPFDGGEDGSVLSGGVNGLAGFVSDNGIAKLKSRVSVSSS